MPPAPVATARWIRVGRSAELDPRSAGASAARAAIGSADARLLVVFASDAYDLEALVAAVHTASGGVPMIGCSTAGEVTSTAMGVDAGDGSVVVAALGGDLDVAVGVGRTDAVGSLRDAAVAAAGCIGDVEQREHRVLMLLSDGLAGDQQEVVRGAHNVVGPRVPLVGGCAGDGMKMERTFQFHNGRVLTGAVVAAALSSPAPFGVGVRHGWCKVGEPAVVTASDGNRVLELDDRPALDVYLERVGGPPEAWTDPEAFTAFAQTHPLALAARASEEQMRFIGGADLEARALVCMAEVPTGALVWCSEGDPGSVLAATQAACREALAPLEGATPAGLFAFDCIARRGVLGEDGIAREVEDLAAACPGAPVAGFYTYGEIARTKGVAGFHHQTLVVLAVG